MKHVLIIGSGLQGLNTAYALKRRGVPDITIIDSAAGPHGASLVHAGQGRYAIRAGQGFVTNSAGQRITLDLNPQRPNATPPNGAQGQPARSR